MFFFFLFCIKSKNLVKWFLDFYISELLLLGYTLSKHPNKWIKIKSEYNRKDLCGRSWWESWKITPINLVQKSPQIICNLLKQKILRESEVAQSRAIEGLDQEK